MTVRIRPAREDYLADVVEIYNYYIAHSPATFETSVVRTEDKLPWFREHTANPVHRLLVAVERSGAVVGWASTSSFRPRAAYTTTVESSVYCRHGLEGRGIGSRLYEALFAALQEQEVERIVAGVALPNPASVALHRRFGFREVGTFTRVGRKLGRFWDVLWLERPLHLLRPPRDTPPPDRPGRGRGS